MGVTFGSSLFFQVEALSGSNAMHVFLGLDTAYSNPLGPTLETAVDRRVFGSNAKFNNV